MSVSKWSNTAVAVLLICSAFGATPTAAQTCFRNGTGVTCSNGVVARQTGGLTIFSDGSSAYSNGNTTTYSNGVKAERRGSTTTFSNGINAYTNGNRTNFSNGRTCYRYGSTVQCN
jgi:hypothetical protein